MLQSMGSQRVRHNRATELTEDLFQPSLAVILTEDLFQPSLAVI